MPGEHIKMLLLSCSPQPATVPYRCASKKGNVSVPDNLREVSRLELLLAPKKSRQSFKPAEESVQSHNTNKAIKLSAQWTDIQAAISKPNGITPGNAAYALQRLGCLNSFASRKRQAGMSLTLPQGVSWAAVLLGMVFNWLVSWVYIILDIFILWLIKIFQRTPLEKYAFASK